MKSHEYRITTTWRAEPGGSTTDHRSYSRDHVIAARGKPDILASSDAAFRGDPSRHNPEDLLVASLSACHMLWYLHLCAAGGGEVIAYVDDASGTMEEDGANGGRFVEVVLRPTVTIADAAQTVKAQELHAPAHKKCFVANSVNFPVRVEATIAASG